MTKAVQFPNGEIYEYSAGLWDREIDEGRCKLLTGKTAETALEDYRRAWLLKRVDVGATLQAVCTYRASSGMSARYRVFVPIVTDEGRNHILEITRQVAELCGFRLSKNNEIIMGGCGYSKPFQIGYDLGRRLWPNGTRHPHGVRNSEPDRDGGYAISVNS